MSTTAAAAAEVSTPIALPVNVDTTGAQILENDADSHPDRRDGRDIYLPNHVEAVSHIALDIGGSLAKVVYFTHSLPNDVEAGPSSPRTPPPAGREATASGVASSSGASVPPSPSTPTTVAYTADGSAAVPSGTLTPTSISRGAAWERTHSADRSSQSHNSAAAAIRSTFLRRRSLPSTLPGGRLNFIKFETADVASLIEFLRVLIATSATANRVSLAAMRRSVKLSATGGGAHLFCARLEEELGVEVRREDEMRCLITGLNFATLIPDEVFSYSDELVSFLHSPLPRSGHRSNSIASFSTDATGSSSSGGGGGGAGISPAPSPPPTSNAAPSFTHSHLPRPSPDPPLYAPVYDSHPSPKLPCLLVNIGSGVSIIKVDDFGKYERVSGTSLGGGTLWGLLSLLTDAQSYDEMLELSSKGDNSAVDMLVGDIYGSSDALSNLGLKSSTIASSFGKVFSLNQNAGVSEGEKRGKKKKFRQEDICKSLLYAVSNNIGQIAYMNAEKFNLDRIYFGGCFLRGHKATISTLSYAIRFWSKGTKRAFFLRHEGYLGAIGAWIRHVDVAEEHMQQQQQQQQQQVGGFRTTREGEKAEPCVVRGLKEEEREVARGVDVPSPVAEVPEPSFAHPNGAHSLAHVPRLRTPPPPNASAAATATAHHEVHRYSNLAPSPTHASSAPLSSSKEEAKEVTEEAREQRKETSVTPRALQPSLPSALAEALGGLELDAPARVPVRNGVSFPNGLSQHGALTSDSSTPSELEAEAEDTSPLQALLASLAPSDRALLEPLLSKPSADGAAEPDVLELLERLEAASGAAEGLEERLDGFLARLDGMLAAQEGEKQGRE